MKRHAYLIIAHDKLEQLKMLLSFIDDPRNDIYLLIDKKSEIELTENTINLSSSKLTLLKRININWGGYSQIKAEMMLLEEACKNNHYQYYHLLSGADLPLHNQDYIHNFYKQNEGKNFLTFCSDSIKEKNKIEDRVNYYWLLNDTKFKFKHLLKIQRKVTLPFQKLIRINRSKNLGNLAYGSNWFSITDDLARSLLSEKKKIEKSYRNTFCADEVFLHTYVVNSGFANTVYEINGVNDKPEDRQGNLRYINWWEGSPKQWTIDDKKQLSDASKRGYLFSRKFNIEKDIKMQQFITQLINSENNNKDICETL